MHNTVLLGTITTLGVAFTEILCTAEFVQLPVAEVPISEYVVLTEGLILILALVAPVFQVYVPAPPALMLSVLPLHRTVALGTIVTVGVTFTLILCTAAFVHPFVLPVTV